MFCCGLFILMHPLLLLCLSCTAPMFMTSGWDQRAFNYAGIQITDITVTNCKEPRPFGTASTSPVSFLHTS